MYYVNILYRKDFVEMCIILIMTISTALLLTGKPKKINNMCKCITIIQLYIAGILII